MLCPQVVSSLQNSVKDHMMAPADADSHNGCGHAHSADGGAGAAEEEDVADAGAGPGAKRARTREGAAAGAEADVGSGSAAEESEESEEEEEEGESEAGSGDLVFPAAYAPALAQLLGARAAGGVPVRDIRLPSKEEKLGLAYTLWSEGVLSTVPRQPGRA